MAWFYLCIAGLLEVGWAVGMKLSDGFKKPAIAAPTVSTVSATSCSSRTSGCCSANPG